MADKDKKASANDLWIIGHAPGGEKKYPAKPKPPQAVVGFRPGLRNREITVLFTMGAPMEKFEHGKYWIVEGLPNRPEGCIMF